MTPTELRALADRLDNDDAPYYEASLIINDELSQAMDIAADYLRQQAEQKPVGMYEHRSAEMRYGVRWLVDELPDGTPLYTHPATAAPQATVPAKE